MFYYRTRPEVMTLPYREYVNEYFKTVDELAQSMIDAGYSESGFDISYNVYLLNEWGGVYCILEDESVISRAAADKFEEQYYTNCYQPVESHIRVRNARMQKWWDEAHDEELQARLQAERDAEQEARRIEQEKKEEERLAKQEAKQQNNNAIMEKVREQEENLRKQAAGIISSTSKQNSNIYKMFNTFANNLRPGSIGDVQTMANNILSIASDL